MNRIPNPDTVFPNEYGTSCFLKNVITAPNIFVGDYTYYDDPAAPADFEKNNVLFNWPNSATDSSSGSSAALRARALHYGQREPPDVQRHHLPIQCIRRRMG